MGPLEAPSGNCNRFHKIYFGDGYKNHPRPLNIIKYENLFLSLFFTIMVMGIKDLVTGEYNTFFFSSSSDI